MRGREKEACCNQKERGWEKRKGERGWKRKERQSEEKEADRKIDKEESESKKKTGWRGEGEGKKEREIDVEIPDYDQSPLNPSNCVESSVWPFQPPIKSRDVVWSPACSKSATDMTRTAAWPADSHVTTSQPPHISKQHVRGRVRATRAHHLCRHVVMEGEVDQRRNMIRVISLTGLDCNSADTLT